MNRDKITIGVIVAIIILLGSWYYSSRTTNSPVPPELNGGTTDTALSNSGTRTIATPSTFKSIFSQSGNHQCTYEQVGQTSRSNSVIYIADGKMRGEFRTVSGDVSSTNIMIYLNGYLYSWKEGATSGKRSSITSISELPQAIPSDLTSGAVYGTSGENVSWDCHDWLKDTKTFVVPRNIFF